MVDGKDVGSPEPLVLVTVLMSMPGMGYVLGRRHVNQRRGSFPEPSDIWNPLILYLYHCERGGPILVQ